MYESIQALAPLLRRGHERVEPHRILQPERSHPRSLQLAQVRAAPDLLPQIVRQRAQVGSFRAAHEDARIRRTEPEEPRFVDVDLPRLALHLLAGARQLVEPPAVDLARRVHGRRLLHQADEVAQRLANALFAQAFERSRLHRAPGAVLRVGGDAEADDGVVLLVSLADEAGDLGGVADADRLRIRRVALDLGVRTPGYQPPSSRDRSVSHLMLVTVKKSCHTWGLRGK